MKNIITITIAIIIMGMGIATPVSAQTRLETFRENTGEIKQNVLEQRETFKENRCTRITERVELRKQSYINHKERYTNRYQTVVAKLNEVVQIIENAGGDTTQLEQYIREFENLKSEFVNELDAVISQLQNTETAACGDNEGGFNAALTQARLNLSNVRNIAIESRNMFVNNIRPEIIRLRQQILEAQ